MNIHTHSEECSAGYHRAAWRRANEILPDALRDALVLQAALDGCDYQAIQHRLNQARADIADGITDERGRLTWNYG